MCLAKECISSQLAYWKRNDLICQDSLNINGKTRQGVEKAGEGASPEAGFWGTFTWHLAREQQSPFESHSGSENFTLQSNNFSGGW